MTNPKQCALPVIHLWMTTLSAENQKGNVEACSFCSKLHCTFGYLVLFSVALSCKTKETTELMQRHQHHIISLSVKPKMYWAATSRKTFQL